MKQIIVRCILWCAAALAFTGCIREGDALYGEAGTDYNRIVVDIESASLPLTRANASGVEIAVKHLDVIIFDEQNDKKWNERVNTENGTGKTGKVTLRAQKKSFTKDQKYWVYVIANSTLSETNFNQLQDLNGLKSMTQKDEYIHLTGLKDAKDVPQTFLMDGIAYEANSGTTTTEPATPATVVLNKDMPSHNTELKVTLRRAAAKIVVKINPGSKVKFKKQTERGQEAAYYLRKMPVSTAVPAGIAHTPTLLTPEKANYEQFLKRTEQTSTPDGSTEPVTTITGYEVTTYAYAHKWENLSLDQEVHLVMNIPLTFDEETTAPEPYENNWYQIPVSANKTLVRNGYYEVTITINAPGSKDPEKPTEVDMVNYTVQEWGEKTINVGDDDSRPAYLKVNKEEMEMYNIDTDNTTLSFASSSEASATVTEAYYYDKFGQKKNLTQNEKANIKITPDAALSGKITVYSPLPNNNTILYIEVEVKNEDNITRKVTIAQYPLVYITNIEGYYSYRDDFISKNDLNNTSGLTTWELLAGMSKDDTKLQNSKQQQKEWICGCTWNNNKWQYDKTIVGFFGSKVVKEVHQTGLSDIEYARWTQKTNGNGNNKTYSYSPSTSNLNLTNHRMYHVIITATSGEYTLGRPRITDGITDSDPDNAKLVSPSFMLASQLGAVQNANNVNIAADHCKQYVEVAKDGTKYDDWRLPTKAEVEIIYKFQYASVAMDEVLGGDRYWSASELVPKPGTNNPEGYYIRCIRDAFDKKTIK